MKLSKIKKIIDDTGECGSATIYQKDGFVKCAFHLIIDGKVKMTTKRYKAIETDIKVNFNSTTVLEWNKKNRFAQSYINYYRS